MDRRQFVLSSTATLVSSIAAAGRSEQGNTATATEIAVDLHRDAGALPHYWENTIGSDRLAVAFREPWLADMTQSHELCGFRSVRCHGLFDDEMGICQGVTAAGPVTSFVYLDQIYDRLLALGVKPFVELSFMPTALASSRNAIFWYRGNASPPSNPADWSRLLEALTRHLIQRYGIAEVSQWRFECWNEPNLSFWAGTQAAYFELYRLTATTLKRVDARLQVGGPATAEMMWIPEFLAYCRSRGAPIDFVSTHVYADDPQENLFGRANRYPFEEVIPRAVAQANEQIRAAGFAGTPLVVSEWSSQNPAFIAQTLRDCLGLAETMSFWQVSSVFEEQGPPKSFATSQYGLFLQSGVPRASLHTFTLLHRLGDQRVWSGTGPLLASRRADGATALIAWNLPPRTVRGSAGDPLAAFQSEVLGIGAAKILNIGLINARAQRARLTVLDPAKTSAEAAYISLGKPEYPTREQIAELKRLAALPAAEEVAISNSRVRIELPPNAIALLELTA